MGGRRARAGEVAASGADLLAHVSRDLVGCELQRRSGSRAVVLPPTGRPFEVEVRRDRRKLMDLQVLVVHVAGPDATGEDGTSIVFRHRGQLRRTGLDAKVRGGAAATDVRDALMRDGDLERVSLPLDFTRFEVRPHRGRWRAEIELMGASYVRTTFPPAATYVRLDGEQVRALLATVAAIGDRFPGDDPSEQALDEVRSAARPGGHHLPGRSA